MSDIQRFPAQTCELCHFYDTAVTCIGGDKRLDWYCHKEGPSARNERAIIDPSKLSCKEFIPDKQECDACGLIFEPVDPNDGCPRCKWERSRK